MADGENRSAALDGACRPEAVLREPTLAIGPLSTKWIRSSRDLDRRCNAGSRTVDSVLPLSFFFSLLLLSVVMRLDGEKNGRA
jgi:hypothetical protein